MQELEYRETVEWRSGNNLLLNVVKTKEMMVDFRRMRTVTEPINMMDEGVGVRGYYKNLGEHETKLIHKGRALIGQNPETSE